MRRALRHGLAGLMAAGCGSEVRSTDDPLATTMPGADDGGGTSSSGQEITTEPAPTGTTDPAATGTAESTTAASTSASSDDAGASTEGDDTGEPGPAASCPSGEIAAPLPSVVEGETNDRTSELASACGGPFAPEATYLFTAPHAGSFTFDTIAGCPISEEFNATHGQPICEWDTVLYVLDGACEGDVIACSDDDFGTASVVGVDLQADQTVTVVVDGVGAPGGPFTLRATEQQVTCPIAELGDSLPVTVAAQTAIATDDHDASCFGSTGRPDALFTFTAPHTGAFSFDTPQTAFSTLLFVLDGACAGKEIACSIDPPLNIELTAGSTVTVGVEGLSGDDVGDLNLRAQAL